MKTKHVYVIAGPNGAGKTTFARQFLPEYAKCPHFVNTDLIAQGLSPFSPQIAAMKAGRLVLEQIHEFAQKGTDFGFETTLSGKSYIHMFRTLRQKGYQLRLYFLWIPTVELALARIRDRVAEGGHDVPAADVKRRFYRGISNLFQLYRPLLDGWMLFDNSDVQPRLMAQETGRQLRVLGAQKFEAIIQRIGVKR